MYETVIFHLVTQRGKPIRLVNMHGWRSRENVIDTHYAIQLKLTEKWTKSDSETTNETFDVSETAITCFLKFLLANFNLAKPYICYGKAKAQ